MMTKHFLKQSLRYLGKNKTLSFAKIIGLSISFAVIIFVTTYIYYEISFDNYVPDRDKIHRVYKEGVLNGQNVNTVITSPKLSEVAIDEIPEITETTRIHSLGNAFIEVNENVFNVEGVILADPNFLSFFNINHEKESESAFFDKHGIFISQEIAVRYFISSNNALGSKLKIKHGVNYTEYFVSAVFETLPANSHLKLNLIKPFQNIESEDWNSENVTTYIKTGNVDVSPEKLSFGLTNMVYAHYDVDGNGIVEPLKESNYLKMTESTDVPVIYKTEALKRIHFSNHANDYSITANKTYVYGAMVIAFIILLISSINFVNLSLASLSTRLREIGIRKTNGARAIHLSKMLITDTFLHWTIAFVTAFLIYLASSNLVLHHLNLSISMNQTMLVKILLVSFGFLILFSVLMNIFPIVFYSRKNVLGLLNKKFQQSGNKNGSRNTFIVIQFTLSLIIILSTVILQKQLVHIAAVGKGYDSENILMFRLYDLNRTNRLAFLEELKSNSSVKNVSLLSHYAAQNPNLVSVYFNNKSDNQNLFHANKLLVDGDFFGTYNLELLKGRYFRENSQSDYESVILNEATAKIYMGDGDILDQYIIDDIKYKVVGVVKNFNYKSLHFNIEPLIISKGKYIANVAVKINQGQSEKALLTISSLWKKFNIKRSFYYEFQDDVLAQQYIKDKQAQKLMLLLSILSIIIACIGLYGILFFSIRLRTKELAIRIINGASRHSVAWSITGVYVRLVVYSTVVAIPICFIAMHKWLENFAYKTNLSWWIFLLSGFLAIGIVLLTVGWQSWKAATRNPVEALRYE